MAAWIIVCARHPAIKRRVQPQSFFEFVTRGHLSKIHSNFCVCEHVCVCVCVYTHIYIYYICIYIYTLVEESSCSVGDLGSIPELGGGHGNPLQYSCLENSRDRRAWWGVAESDMTEQVSIACVCVCVCVCVYN